MRNDTRGLALCLFAALCLAVRVSATNAIRVMTFNLRYASAADGDNNWENANQQPDRREVVVATITNCQPDVIGFQEGEDIQISYLMTNLPTYGFEAQGPSGGGGNENAAFAYNTNVLALIDRGVFSLGPSPGSGYWNNAPGTNFAPWILFPEVSMNFPRLALWGQFSWRATGQEFLFYTTHFDTYNGTYNGESQVKSAWLITDDALARNNRMPLSPLAIGVGDFNSHQWDRAWQLFTGAISSNGLTGDFTDSWYQVHGTWNDSGTFHGFSGGTQPGNSRIDWILHRGGFAATDCRIVTNATLATVISPSGTRTQYPSDHYPVFAVLRLPDPSADFD